MTLELLPYPLSIARLEGGAPTPEWAEASRLLSLFRGEEETSVICETSHLEEGITAESGWCALKLAGAQPFTLTGVLSSILTPLAEAKVSILAFSTYDTDYVMVKADRLEDAFEALGPRMTLRYRATGRRVASRLETERLLLRRLRVTDREGVFSYAGSEENTRYMSFSTHASIADTDRFLKLEEENALSGDRYNWGVVERSSGRLMGTVGISRLESESGELGYILNREFWGKGYATEAAGRVMEFAFRTLGLKRLHAFAQLGNDASLRVLEKLGMRRLGVESNITLRHAQPVASHHLELFAREYEATLR